MKIDQITLNPAACAGVLGLVAALLVLLSIGGQLSTYILGHDYLKGIVPLFYLGFEGNIPTFFSMLLLLSAAALLAVIARLNSRHGMPYASKWLILSTGFLYLAYDEAFSVHERFIKPVRSLLGDDSLGIFYYAWVIPGMVIVIMLALFFFNFLLSLPSRDRLMFLLSAGLYLGGAIGFELVGGSYAEMNGVKNLAYTMIVTVEEGLEMAGVIVFIYALLEYCSDNYREVRFRIEGGGDSRE